MEESKWFRVVYLLLLSLGVCSGHRELAAANVEQEKWSLSGSGGPGFSIKGNSGGASGSTGGNSGFSLGGGLPDISIDGVIPGFGISGGINLGGFDIGGTVVSTPTGGGGKVAPTPSGGLGGFGIGGTVEPTTPSSDPDWASPPKFGSGAGWAFPIPDIIDGSGSVAGGVDTRVRSGAQAEGETTPRSTVNEPKPPGEVQDTENGTFPSNGETEVGTDGDPRKDSSRGNGGSGGNGAGGAPGGSGDNGWFQAPDWLTQTLYCQPYSCPEGFNGPCGIYIRLGFPTSNSTNTPNTSNMKP